MHTSHRGPLAARVRPHCKTGELKICLSHSVVCEKKYHPDRYLHTPAHALPRPYTMLMLIIALLEPIEKKYHVCTIHLGVYHTPSTLYMGKGADAFRRAAFDGTFFRRKRNGINQICSSPFLQCGRTRAAGGPGCDVCV